MVDVKKICCIGAGYVGGPTCTMIAYKCPHIMVTVVDVNADRIASWNSNKLPIYEPGLEELVFNCRNRNLFFSSDIDKAIEEADLIFVSVNAPTKQSGIGKGYVVDLTYLESCARRIAEIATTDKIVVEKSTVPVHSADAINKILSFHSPHGAYFKVLSNPEFLAKGTAITNLETPDRVLIGGSVATDKDRAAMNALIAIYTNWVHPDRIITTSLWSAELSKLVTNAMLAQRISSMNSISALCEVTGADVNEITLAIGYDLRIGSKFLKSSVGFGGSCFQKDILHLVYLCRNFNLHKVADYWHHVILINNYQKERFAKHIVKQLFNTVTNKKICILGFSFKKDTGDTRASPAIDVCKALLEEGAHLGIYDPKVPGKQVYIDLLETGVPNASGTKTSIEIYHDPYMAANRSYALVICTDWNEFTTYDYQRIYCSMYKPAFVFDGRKILNHSELKNIGFNVEVIGYKIIGENN